MQGWISDFYNYPIKGLTPQALDRVRMAAGQGFPFDRMFGLARHDSGFDLGDPRPIPKDRFLVLVNEERLAGLQTHFDPENLDLSIRIQGHVVFEGCLRQSRDVRRAMSFFATMFDLDGGRRPVFAHAAPHRFTDVSVVSKDLMNAVSLINLASVRDLEARIGAPVDPLRFRANIYFDGWPAFSEFDLLERRFRIGDVRLRATLRTRRCAATEVKPGTGRRDMPISRLVMQHYGHSDMGVYAEVLSSGVIRRGDPIRFDV